MGKATALCLAMVGFTVSMSNEFSKAVFSNVKRV